MKLNNEDLNKIYYDDSCLVEQVGLSIGSYYVKYCNINTMFMELLGKKVFDLVGIKSADYKYIKEKGCLLSKDLNGDKYFYSCYDFYIMRANTLEQVMNGLDRISIKEGYNVDKVKFQIEIMHFIDILFSNIDRHISNFGFYLQDDNEVELVLLDNEYFLQNFKTATRPMACGDDEIDSQDFMNVSKSYEASRFFENMSDDLKEVILKYLELFSPERVEVLLNTIEDEQCLSWPLKASSLREYKRNYKMICKLLHMKKGFSFRKSK